MPMVMRLVVALGGSLALLAGAGHEPPPVLEASKALPKELVAGPRFKVEDKAPTDGYMPRFTVTSDFGAYTVDGREMLEVRVREIAALDKLDEVSKGEAFAKAMGQSAKQTGKAVAHAATNPVETAKGVPAGVGRFFKGVGSKAKKGAEEVVEDDDSAEGGKGAGDKAADAAKSVSGASRAKRQWAKQAGVDPYSTNPALQKKLDELATASTAGGLAVNVLNPVAMVGTVARVNSLVWDTPAPDLQKLNDGKLGKMGVKPETRKAFFKNPYFSPTQQTGFVAALEALPGAAGVDAVVALAARATKDEDDARFYRRTAEVLARYQKAAGPIASLEARKRLFLGRARSGALVVPVGVDILTWTEDVDAFTAEPDAKASRHEAWISGKASDRARRELTQRGWSIREEVLG
jgi:hypothetical protein